MSSRPSHLLPSAHRLYIHRPDKDPNIVDVVPNSDSNESFPSANIGEEVGAGGEDRSPSPGGDTGASLPKGPCTVLCKRKATTSSGEAMHVMNCLLDAMGFIDFSWC